MPPSRPKPLTLLYWSLIATTALAAILVIGTFWLAARSQAENEWVRHTLAVRNQIDQVLILVQRAEANARGYLLTGQEVFVSPYQNAVTQLPAVLDEMTELVVDHPRQQQAVLRLRQLTAERLVDLRNAIAAYKSGQAGGPAEMASVGKDLQTMQDFRQLVAAMTAEENRLLQARQTSSATFSVLLQIGAGASFVLICAVGALVGVTTQHSFMELGAARDRLMLTNRELLEQINLRESAEGQLRQSQKMEAIGQLTGGIAHDFNNMLGVISGSLDLIERRIKKGDYGIERFIDAAVKAADRAAALTHRLLAFARQQPLSPEPLDANKMIINMSELLRSTLGEHIAIETVSAAGLWRTKADALQLENALLNIAINARDAMGDGGRLTIETANAYLDAAYCKQHGEVTPGQFVLIAITDTGMGMKPEVVARVFDPFFTTKLTGTGLGLSQVYGFVKQSHGHIKIYSEPGAGTTVKIYLPRFIGDADETKGLPTTPVETGSASEAILVVEDDPLMRRLTIDALRELGYSVLDCETAADALDILERTPNIKLLLTDVVMPEVNGKKLADEAVRRCPDLKVLFTTGYTPNAVVHGGVLDPGVQFLAKPFTLEQLAAKVRNLLDNSLLDI
ncbi:MAG: CHASE3 domain-containing protein [Methylovirgula sp.]